MARARANDRRRGRQAAEPERECLVAERTRIVNRIKATLARLGVRNFKPTLRKAVERLATVRFVARINSRAQSTPEAAFTGGERTPAGQARVLDLRQLGESVVVVAPHPDDERYCLRRIDCIAGEPLGRG